MKLPNLALGTVYRTLDFLTEKGLILKLKTKGTKARYDGDIKKHCHLICEKCGFVTDIFDVEKISVESRDLKKTGFKINSDFAELSGICKKCK